MSNKWATWLTDDAPDWLLQNDTVRMLYAYHDRDPMAGEPLPYHGSQRGARSVFLLERVPREDALPRDTLTWDLRNPAVSVLLPFFFFLFSR